MYENRNVEFEDDGASFRVRRQRFLEARETFVRLGAVYASGEPRALRLIRRILWPIGFFSLIFLGWVIASIVVTALGHL